MKKVCTLILICTVSLAIAQSKHPTSYKFINGQWFDGTKFVKRDAFVNNGLFVGKLDNADTTIDLAGKFVLPPFSEAHTHSLEGIGNIDATVSNYLRAGVFYLKNPNNIKPWTERLVPKVNHGHSVDAVFANGGLTCTGGHPEILYEVTLRHHLGDVLKDIPQGWFKGRSYFNIDNEADIEKEWPNILAGKPDFIKVYYANSEDIGDQPPVPNVTLRKGLDPKVAAKVVTKAHLENLRVSAHVETRIDFINAVNAGVDEITHTPGFFLFSKDHLDRYRLKKEDAQLAASRNIVVITAIHSRNLTTDNSLQPLVDKILSENFAMLRNNGVRLAIGSDHAASPVDEVMELKRLGPFDNLTILNIWCVETPLTIFPKRKLGKLEAGYEGSFIALNKDPLEDLSNIKTVDVRFKQGHLLH